MSPEVEAAIIAAGVGILTLIGAVYGTRKTSQDTKDALTQQLAEQGKQLDKTLAEQREQLDKTLNAQSDQLDRTLTEQRTRTLNERFATAAGQLGSDKPPAVRLAGVYAMAGLADDWEENRQTCVDVLCAYLRLPYAPDPGEDDAGHKRLDFRASREVRHTVIRVITAHLQLNAKPSWQGLNFDFTGVVFDGGDFSGANFASTHADFSTAEFSGGVVNFGSARFSGGGVDFSGANFSGGEVTFRVAKFCGGTVSFGGAKFSGATVSFPNAEFSGGTVYFGGGAEFSGGTVDLSFAEFSGGTVDLSFAKFSGSKVNFDYAKFSNSNVEFGFAKFSSGTVSFHGAVFSGGMVDFSSVGDWSCPPKFPWTGTPPSGVKLPKKEAQSQV